LIPNLGADIRARREREPSEEGVGLSARDGPIVHTADGVRLVLERCFGAVVMLVGIEQHCRDLLPPLGADRGALSGFESVGSFPRTLVRLIPRERLAWLNLAPHLAAIVARVKAEPVHELLCCAVHHCSILPVTCIVICPRSRSAHPSRREASWTPLKIAL